MNLIVLLNFKYKLWFPSKMKLNNFLELNMQT